MGKYINLLEHDPDRAREHFKLLLSEVIKDEDGEDYYSEADRGESFPETSILEQPKEKRGIDYGNGSQSINKKEKQTFRLPPIAAGRLMEGGEADWRLPPIPLTSWRL